MSTRTRAVLFASILFLHYALSWAALVYLLSASYRLEAGASETLLDTTVRVASLALSAPLMPLVYYFRIAGWFPGLSGHLLLVANGALWAGAILWITVRWKGRTKTPELPSSA